MDPAADAATPLVPEFREWLAGLAGGLAALEGALFAFPSSHDSTVNGLTEEEFEGLPKLTVEENSYVLRRTVVRVGSVEVEAVAAAFAATVPAAAPIAGCLVAADPLHGETPLRNVEQVTGNIVLMDRGVCTFAEKTLRARDAGAHALIIAQTHDVWPYVMTDSSGTVSGDNATLPVVMVSRRDGEMIRRALQQAEATGQSVQCQLHSSEHSQECIICARNYETGDLLVRLPCAHHYHRDCIGAWLRTHRTCPLCRYEIPRAKSTKEGGEAPTPQGLAELLASMLQQTPDPPAPEYMYG